MAQRVLVGGGAGFLGSHLVPRLVAEGYSVVVMDVVPPESASKLHALLPEIEYRWQSISDVSLLEDFDYVIHMAGVADVPFALTSPTFAFQQNAMGPLRMLEAVLLASKLHRASGLKLVLYLSSEAVYGRVPSEHLPIAEHEPLNPTNVYGASKAAAELLLQSFHNSYGIPTCVFRSSSIYGERMRAKQVIPIFIKQALRNQPITIEGDGQQTRDFNYVENLVDAIVLAVKAPEPCVGEVFNIAAGRETSLLELASMIRTALGSASETVHKPFREGEAHVRHALSIAKAIKLLGYHPAIQLEEGLHRTIEWLRSETRVNL